MKLIVSTHDVTLTEAINNHLQDRIDRLEHLDGQAINARIVLEHDNTRAPEKQFKCSVQLSMPGPDLFAEDVESDLYAAIDLSVKKIEQQLRKRHGKFKAQKHTEEARNKRTVQGV
jgi:putative sigma-54 modulation protein